MKKGIKIVLILAAVFLALGIALCIVSLSMGANPVKLVSDGTYTISINKLDDLDDIFDIEDRIEDDREGSFGQRPGNFADAGIAGDDSYSVNGDIKNLEIDWVSGNVKIVRGVGERITFSESASDGIDADDRLFYTVDGDTLKISCCDDNTISIGININGGCGNKELVVSVPYELRGIHVDTTSADVEAENIKLSEAFSVSTTSGGVRAKGVQCNSVVLDSISGRIEYNGVCDEFSGSSTSGNIVFAGECSDFESDTTSGKVEAEFSAMPHEISADTISGEVYITLPADASFELEYDTVSGDLDCDFPLKLRDGDYVVGSGGAEADIDTTSGNLSIKSK